MLLILSNTQDATADYLAQRLERHGVEFIRFDTDRSLADAEVSYEISSPSLRLGSKWFSPEDFTHVWLRRPERIRHPEFGDSPEGKFALNEWSEAVEGFLAHIRSESWLNHPACNVAASHKIDQLTRARALGLLEPDTLVTQDAARVRRFADKYGGRIVAKPMSKGYVQRSDDNSSSLIYTNLLSPDDLARLKDLSCCPTLFQQYVEKQYDVRITLVDCHLHAVALVAHDSDGFQRCDIRRNDMDDVSYHQITLPPDVEHKVRSLAGCYGLRFAAIDMALGRDGGWYFFEVNPNGQWAWLDLSGVTDIAKSFIEVFAARE